MGEEEGGHHPLLVANNPRSNFWPSACAEQCSGGTRDQASPSHFLWLLLGCSFDLFIAKTAEVQGTGAVAMPGSWHRAGDGRPRDMRAWPSSSGHQRRWQADVTLSPTPCLPAQEGRDQVGRRMEQQKAPSHALGQAEPVASSGVWFGV